MSIEPGQLDITKHLLYSKSKNVIDKSKTTRTPNEHEHVTRMINKVRLCLIVLRHANASYVKFESMLVGIKFRDKLVYTLLSL